MERTNVSNTAQIPASYSCDSSAQAQAASQTLSAQQQMPDRVSSDNLNEIFIASKESKSLWFQLGTQLGVSDADMCIIKESNNNSGDGRLYAKLLKLAIERGKLKNKHDLSQAMTKTGFRKNAENFLKNMTFYSHNHFPRSIGCENKTLVRICEKEYLRHALKVSTFRKINTVWYCFGVALNVNQDILDAIDDVFKDKSCAEKCARAVSAWIEEKGSDATASELNHVFLRLLPSSHFEHYAVDICKFKPPQDYVYEPLPVRECVSSAEQDDDRCIAELPEGNNPQLFRKLV